MKGYSPKLPLLYDTTDGSYSMNLSIIDSIKQDLKMLLLTSPGERIMYPDYGVGIRMFLFSQSGEFTSSLIEQTIREQAEKYMNFIDITSIEINEDSLNPNTIGVGIYYSIPYLNYSDTLNLSLQSN